MNAISSVGTLLCLASLLSGCYTYTQVEVDQVPENTTVRARISAARAEQFQETFGRSDRVIAGRVVGHSGDGLLLQVPFATESGGLLAQRVDISRADLIELETRQLDRVRTGGLVAVAAVAVGYGLYAAFGGDSNDSNRPKPGPEQWIGWRFSW